MDSRSRLNLAFTLFAAALSTSAHAASAIDIDGIVFQPGSIFELGELWQGENLAGCNSGGSGNCNGLVDEVGEELAGVGVITSIRAADNSVLWRHGDNGRRLTFHLQGFVAESVTTYADALTDSSVAQILFSGGSVKLYSQENITAFSPTATQAGGIAAATAGNLWLELVGAPTINSTAFGQNFISLISTATAVNPANPLESGMVSSSGRLDVVLRPDTLADDFLNTNAFACTSVTTGGFCPYSSDKAFESAGGLQPLSAGSEWAFSGNLTARSTAVVPVPGSLWLLGSGLAWLAARRKRATV